jgi:hypothetical protein
MSETIADGGVEVEPSTATESVVESVVESMTDQAGTETGAGYEYATVQAPRRLEWVYRDAYRHLGWVLDAFDPEGCRNPALVTLRFRRDLELPNRELLADLQVRTDEALSVIAARERVKTSLVHSSTVMAGIVGAGLIAWGVVSINDGDLLTPILLGALGVVTWLIGVVGRRRLTEIAAARFGLAIDQEYATVQEAGEQAARLLAGTGPDEGLGLVPGQRAL